MLDVDTLCRFLDEFAPAGLAEEWVNVGLLVGHRDRPVRKLMTCLTITPASLAEAVETQVDLIVTHHPLPFRAVKRITGDTVVGRLLLSLAEARIAVYSPHTAFDSAAGGINQRLADGLELSEVRPLVAKPLASGAGGEGETDLGAGRVGRVSSPLTWDEFAARVKQFLRLDRLQVVPTNRAIERVAVACGSAGELLEPALRAGCDALVLGETNFHTCLEAEALGIGLVLTGHFASERFGVEQLAVLLARQFPAAHVWASRREADPLHWA